MANNNLRTPDRSTTYKRQPINTELRLIKIEQELKARVRNANFTADELIDIIGILDTEYRLVKAQLTKQF